MASRDKVDVDTFHKSIQYALEKLGKSKSGFERTVVSKFKRKRRVGSGNELVDYSRAQCLGADQKARGLWERDWVNLYSRLTCMQKRQSAILSQYFCHLFRVAFRILNVFSLSFICLRNDISLLFHSA